MHKRGQITVFVILGILIIAVLGIVFYLYGEKLKVNPEKTSEFDFSRTEVIKNYVEGCIKGSGNEALNLVGKQGGEIDPGFYQNWNCASVGSCDHVSYACYTNEYAACYNKKPFLSEFVKSEITSYVSDKINTCVQDLGKIAIDNGYTLQATGNLVTTVDIFDYSTVITIDYPITITSNTGSKIQETKFGQTFNVPLGRLITVAKDIVNQEIKNPQGVVLYDAYALAQNGEILIERHTYSDTEIYIAQVPDNPYKFQFAVQNYVTPFP